MTHTQYKSRKHKHIDVVTFKNEFDYSDNIRDMLDAYNKRKDAGKLTERDGVYIHQIDNITADDFTSRPEWYGANVENMKTCFDYLANGYNADIKALDAAYNNITKADVERVRRVVDVVGAFPVVGRALAGRPDSMRRTVKRPADNVIKLYVETSVSWNVDAKKEQAAAEKILQYAGALEHAGYALEINTICCNFMGNDGADVGVTIVNLKHSDSHVNVSRLAFPLTHPAYFRVLTFANIVFNENITGYVPGLGRPAVVENYPVVKAILPRDAQYISLQDIVNGASVETVIEKYRNTTPDANVKPAA